MEIEEFIQTKFENVHVCAVGIEDFVLPMNEILAVAILKEKSSSHLTEEMIVSAVKEELDNYKQIRGGVYFLDHFPFTTTGKIKRNEVKKCVTNLYCGKHVND